MNPQIIFWIFSALFLLLAMVFLLPPLLRKPKDIIDDRREQNISITKSQLAELELDYKEGGLEEETYLQAKEELEDALYSDLDDAEDGSSVASNQKQSKVAVIAVAILVPVIAIGLYLKIGNLQGITESSVSRTAVNEGNAQQPKMTMDEAVQKLEEKLKSDPKNHTGWAMLGRTYMILNQPDKAVNAYTKALELNSEDATTMLHLADALGSSNNGVLTGKPEEYILKALKKDPENLMGLWLAGMSAKQRGANAEAVEFWKKVLPKLDPASGEKEEVMQLITNAGGSVEGMSQATANNAQPSTQANAPAATTGATITVKIDISDALKSKVSAEQIVFIYAKAVSGSPMPLAAVRKQVKDLPIEVVLDDSMAMTPQSKISAFKQVKVGARVSLTGTATKSPGDLYVEQSPVALGDSISLTIDKVVE